MVVHSQKYCTADVEAGHHCKEDYVDCRHRELATTHRFDAVVVLPQHGSHVQPIEVGVLLGKDVDAELIVTGGCNCPDSCSHRRYSGTQTACLAVRMLLCIGRALWLSWLGFLLRDVAHEATLCSSANTCYPQASAHERDGEHKPWSVLVAPEQGEFAPALVAHDPLVQ